MPTVNLPEFRHVQAYSYNMNPRGGQRLDLTWQVTLYALRGLGLWLIGEWRSEARARVYVKSGSQWRYKGCVGFKGFGFDGSEGAEGVQEDEGDATSTGAGTGMAVSSTLLPVPGPEQTVETW